MHDELARNAIKHALSGDWVEAIKTNEEILSQEPDNIEALTRISKAYYELGEQKSALKKIKEVIKLDPTNPLAQKCLEKYKLDKKQNGENHSFKFENEIFLEEAGKTKVVSLTGLREEKTNIGLTIGEQVVIKIGTHRVTITTQNSKYIGRLPDDISAKLINLIKNQAEYRAVIKGSSKTSVKVLLIQVKKAKNGAIL